MCALYHDIYGDTQKAIKIAKRMLKELTDENSKATVHQQVLLWEADI